MSMNDQITRIKWIAAIITIVILGIIIFGSKIANAGELSVSRMSDVRFVVVEQISGGHKMFYYKAYRNGRIELMNVDVTYKDQMMSIDDYNEFIVADEKEMIKRNINSMIDNQEAKARWDKNPSRDPSGWSDR